MKAWAGLLLLASVAHAADPTAEQVRDAASRGIALIQAGQKNWYSKAACHSCHHQFQPAIAFSVARAHGIPVDETIAHADALKAYPFTDLDAAIQYRDVQETVMDLGYSLVAANATGLEPNLVSAVYARLVAGRQERGGYWDDLHQRPPQSYSNFTQTALGIRAIQLYSHPSQKANIQARVANARRWLESHMPRDTEERTWQLIGLKWAGGSGNAAALLASQHADGGWSSIEGRESEAYSTAEALVALHDGGGVSITDKAWKRGLQYLLSTQNPDGSWHVASRLHPPAQLSPPYFESGYPYGHDQYISASASNYAIMALSYALGAPKAPAPQKWELPFADAGSWAETVLFGSAADLQKLLDKGFDPNSATASGGTTALMMAVPDAAKVKLLIDRGANVNARSKSNYSAVMIAALYREGSEAGKLLLAHGADPMGVPAPMVTATVAGDAELLKPLHDAGAPLDRTLVAAARMGKPDCIQVLLDIGAKVNEPDGADTSPLERAVLANEVEIARTLIEHGANVNRVGKNGMTPLLYAASIDFGNSAMIDLLLKSGAHSDAVTKEGLSALDLAKKYRNSHLIASLTTRN